MNPLDRYRQGMELNALAYGMKLRGIEIDQARRAWHEERLSGAIVAARSRFVEALGPSHSALAELLEDPEVLSDEEIEEKGKWISRLEKLKEIFFETHGLQPTRFSPNSGKPSLDETALKDIIANPAAPANAIMAARALLAYRENHKTLSTYVVKLNPMHPDSFLFHGQSVLHPTWNVLQARTGRWSCSDPNLQNIQKTEKNKAGETIRYGMRDMFVARDGYHILEGDYKQLEVRVIAAITGDDPLVMAFARGVDVYKLAACDIFGVTIDSVTYEQRQMAKIAVLAMNYGGGPPVIHQQLVLSFPKVTPKAVEFMYDRWKNAHPAIFAYQRRIFQFAKDNSYVACPISGRRAQFYLDRIVPTEAANFPIQGTAGDIINPASLRLQARLDRDEEILMQIHDALYVETRNPALTAKKMREAMEIEITFPNGKTMRFDIDLKVGSDWGDMKEYA